MSRRSASIEVTTTIPDVLPLRDAELTVLYAWEGKIRAAFRDPWIGWKYRGRPPDAPRLVSHDAWGSRVDASGDRPTIEIINTARTDAGDFYATRVVRRRGATPEWEVIAEKVEQDLLPQLTADLATAFADAHTAPSKRGRKVRTTGGETVTLSLEL